MGRRIFWDRAASVDQLYSATSEAGLRTGAPTEESVSGLMELFAGGDPTAAKDHYVDLVRYGNLGEGGAEWGWADQSGSDFFGQCAPWIVDNAACYGSAATINPQVRLHYAKSLDVVFMFWVENTVARYAFLNLSTGVWTEKVIGQVNAGEILDGHYFEDTGELVMIVDDYIYSTMDPTDALPSIVTKAVIPGYAASADAVKLVYSRGALLCLYETGNALKVHTSYDRGASWSTANTPSLTSLTALQDLDVAVSPVDGNFYMAVIDLSGGNEDIYIHRSSDGLVWTLVETIGLGVQIGAPGLCALKDGTFLLAWPDRSNNDVMAYILRSDGTYDQYLRTPRNTIDYLWNGWDAGVCVQMVDAGDRVVGASIYSSATTANEVLSTFELRWWSNVSEDNGYTGPCWINTNEAEPHQDWAWTGVSGSGTATKGVDNLQLDTQAGNVQKLYYYNENGADENCPNKVKFRMGVGANASVGSRTCGLRLDRENAAGKGYRLGVFLDDDEIVLYDYQGSAVRGTATVDLSSADDVVDVLLDIDFDATNGGADVTVWTRQPTNGYPYDAWALAIDGSGANALVQAAPWAAEKYQIYWGNNNFDTGLTTSYWYYVFADFRKEEIDDSYANTVSDHSDLNGRLCQPWSQQFANDQEVWFRGAGGAAGDRWSVAVEYAWAKENVHRDDPKLQWRSSADEAVTELVFYESGNRRWHPDWVALFGKNFDQFTIEGDNPSTGLRLMSSDASCLAANAGSLVGGTKFTLSFWAYLNSSMTGSTYYTVWSNYVDATHYESIYVYQDYIYMHHRDGATEGRKQCVLSVTDLGGYDNEWHHFYIVYDGTQVSTNRWLMWIDDESIPFYMNGTYPASRNATTPAEWGLGDVTNFTGGTQECAAQSYAQFRYFHNAALGNWYMRELWANGVGRQDSYTVEATLRCEWLFDEGVGTNVVDTGQDATSHHGTIANAYDRLAEEDIGLKGFSLHVDDCTVAGDNASAFVCQYVSVEAAHYDWVRLTAADAQVAELWKGRFDQDAIAGRNWYMRVNDGDANGEVYLIESVERPEQATDGSWHWALKIAPKADGTDVDLIHDGLDENDHVSIFGDAIAVQIPGSYSDAGVRRLTIKIASIKTHEGDYRLGRVIWGTSAGLDNAIELKEPQWGLSSRMDPNIEVSESPDGSERRRRVGRGRRVIDLQWTGLPGGDSWQSAIRALLEAASSDVQVVFVENDEGEHTGPTTPTGTVCRVSHDPILCTVDGVIEAEHACYDTHSPLNMSTNQRAMRTNVRGVVLREVV